MHPDADAPQLRLVTETEAPVSYKFERRQAPRHSMDTRVTAVAFNRDSTDGRTGTLGALDLYDSSATGLGGYSDHEIPLGATVALYFPARGKENGYDAVGTVVRSVRVGDRWSIGLSLAVNQAAA